MRVTFLNSISRFFVYVVVALLVVVGYFLATFVSASLTTGSVQSFADEEALIMPGTWLLRFDGVEATYYVADNNRLRQLSYANAERLYGEDWTQFVLVLPIEAYENYRIAEPIGSEEYPDNLFLTDGESRCYLEAGLCRPVTESGMEANGISEQFLLQTTSEIIHSFELGKLIDA